jgi:hypothetical protein
MRLFSSWFSFADRTNGFDLLSVVSFSCLVFEKTAKNGRRMRLQMLTSLLLLFWLKSVFMRNLSFPHFSQLPNEIKVLSVMNYYTLLFGH